MTDFDLGDPSDPEFQEMLAKAADDVNIELIKKYWHLYNEQQEIYKKAHGRSYEWLR